MALTPEINESGGIKPTESRLSTWVQYVSSGPKKAKQNKLRKGEVVFGEIIKMHSSSDAEIRLPHGTFQASVKGELQSGDSLFFLVYELNPSLNLRIYAITTVVKGNKITTSEAVRLLNLPKTTFYNELMRIFIDYKSIIIRESVAQIHVASLNLTEKEIGKNNLSDLLKTMYFLQDASIPLEPDNIGITTQLFTDNAIINELFNGLIDTISKLPPSIYEKFRKLLRFLFDNDKNARFIMRWITTAMLDPGDDDIFMNLLQEIKSIEYSTISEINRAKSYAERIIAILNAQTSWNSLSLKNKGILHFFMPLIIKNEFKITRLVIAKDNQSISGNKAQLLNGNLIVSKLSSPILENDAQIKSFIAEFLDNLQIELTSKKLKIISFSFEKDEFEKFFRDESSLQPILRNMTVVI